VAARVVEIRAASAEEAVDLAGFGVVGVGVVGDPNRLQAGDHGGIPDS
jgi:hypothetical protein